MSMSYVFVVIIASSGIPSTVLRLLMKQDSAPVKAQSYSHGPRCSIVLFDLVPSCQVSRFQRPLSIHSIY